MADKTIAFWNDWLAVVQDMHAKVKRVTLFTLPQSGIVLFGNFNAIIDKYSKETYPQETLTDDQQTQVAEIYTNFVTEFEKALELLSYKKSVVQTNSPPSRVQKALSGLEGVANEHSSALLSQAPNAAAIKEQNDKLRNGFEAAKKTYA